MSANSLYSIVLLVLAAHGLLLFAICSELFFDVHSQPPSALVKSPLGGQKLFVETVALTAGPSSEEPSRIRSPSLQSKDTPPAVAPSKAAPPTLPIEKEKSDKPTAEPKKSSEISPPKKLPEAPQQKKSSEPVKKPLEAKKPPLPAKNKEEPAKKATEVKKPLALAPTPPPASAPSDPAAIKREAALLTAAREALRNSDQRTTAPLPSKESVPSQAKASGAALSPANLSPAATASQSSVAADQGNSMSSSREKGKSYEARITEEVKRYLTLPECGEVAITVTIDSRGSVIALRIDHAESRLNAEYIERELPRLRFPPITSYFPGEQSHAFPILLSHEL